MDAPRLNILKPLFHGPKSRFKFAVYDIETYGIGNLNFHSCGFFDGEQYWYFRSMEDFLSHVLRKEYNGWRFFAHFGGRFDVHFVFDWLRKFDPNLYMEVNCSGSAVISLTLREGKNRWRFVDSFRLMPKSLASLTNDFNVLHKKLVGRDFKEREYNEYDCRGLYEVLEIFFDEFDICSETIASHAMRVYRSHFMQRELWQPKREIEEFCRFAYAGGRCEIFRYDEAEVNQYDVNSLYPSAMLETVPVEYLFQSREIPDSDDRRIGFYKADIHYPDCYLPILPVHTDKLYFPVGDFTGIYTSMELRKAIEAGAAVRILEGRVFTAEPILRDYALQLFEMKKEADLQGQGAKRYIAKILMNSLYGKWGQRREQRVYILDDGREGLYPLPNGLAYYMSESQAAHILPHISAVITARARIRQHSLLSQARNWYTDTDSLFTDANYEVSDDLGSLHFEGAGKFQAFRLKEYRFKNGYKIKGLQRSKAETQEQRDAEDKRLAELYLQGEELIMPRMRGWAESVKAGLPAVGYVERKRRRRVVRDKRCRIKEDSRPWNYRELFD